MTCTGPLTSRGRGPQRGSLGPRGGCDRAGTRSSGKLTEAPNQRPGPRRLRLNGAPRPPAAAALAAGRKTPSPDLGPGGRRRGSERPRLGLPDRWGELRGGGGRGRCGAPRAPARRKCPLGRGRRRRGHAAGFARAAPRAPRCRPGRGARTRGLGARGVRGSRRSRSCSGVGSRSGGGTTRSSCSSSSTWSPFMKNLLLGSSRKMRLSPKTAYQMYQAMNMPGNFWLTHRRKDFGCHWGKKSKLCSDTAVKTVAGGFYLG
ncbi:retinitis pigmentosa 9 protein isoform X1 [Callithrix jacchus]|uniref:retinitis pigmentosa 9 protein isoform X1 n=1 Tax=Callithrix jacchus TaxID=9483 RepID=UPI0023DD5E88|nr:retinitis pigmentosa 9 protein isoform X1 [Callithrix jacchus]